MIVKGSNESVNWDMKQDMTCTSSLLVYVTRHDVYVSLLGYVTRHDVDV
jgi:hypothetical protein